ncbi:MAG: type IA DNA topoisomerase [Lachnospiraceae bacterium]|nr:type IA DNA topoisomerase [Lachnospiraceae bacterium]
MSEAVSKTVFIAEKPSVAKQFAEALKLKTKSYDGYLESENTIVTWCVGHLITMSYPDAYDKKYKKWSFATLPFLPTDYKYEVIPSAKKQYQIVKKLLTRPDVATIYVCTDSGREGEYIYRLVDQEAGVTGKTKKRVWIDSQTEEEIRRGIKEAKDLSEYDALADAAYLRAKEDYLMGINFSRALSLKYGDAIADFLHMKFAVVSVGRVMTCVLGMVVRREREIREFVKTPFYRLIAATILSGDGNDPESQGSFPAEFKAVEGSAYYLSPKLYKENGFKEREDAKKLIEELLNRSRKKAVVDSIERKKEKKNPPLLYNLAELQNQCSKLFKISPEETLRIVQELYERKLVTYPRTDARVLSTAIAKEIQKNIGGLKAYPILSETAEGILSTGSFQGIAKTRYVDDKKITDHYAIIPTGQGLSGLSKLPELSQKVYEVIARRFLGIFLEPAEYLKTSVILNIGGEKFFANFKLLAKEGFLSIWNYSFIKKKEDNKEEAAKDENKEQEGEEAEEISCDEGFLERLKALKKGTVLQVSSIDIKEGETTPPKRYTSGSMILAMENAGQLIEDEELRAQIKGSGIGTSATRAGILEKLFKNGYLRLNQKTQMITPELLGEMIYDIVAASIKPMLDPKLTASWEKGLTQVAGGEISADVYMEKLNDYVARRTNSVRALNNQAGLRNMFQRAASNYTEQQKK